MNKKTSIKIKKTKWIGNHKKNHAWKYRSINDIWRKEIIISYNNNVKLLILERVPLIIKEI